MIDGLNPALILIGGSLLVLLAPQGRARNLFMLALPVLGALQL